MKNLLFVLASVFISVNTTAQILDPVKWSTSVEKISNTEYELIATASIEPGWHLYSQTVPENGPLPTKFGFTSSGNYLKKGNTKESKGHTDFDPVFEMQIKYFETIAVFKQRVKTTSQPPFKVNGFVEFMVCDDTRCLPPTEVELVFNIK